MSKKQWLLLIVIGGLFLFPLTVQAGGWSLVSLVDLPDGFVANEPTTVQFRVLRHGVHPETGLTPEVKAVHADSDAKITVEAVPTAEEGLYEATLEFPMAGDWAWEINAYGGVAGYDFPMPTVTVQEINLAPAAVHGAADVWLMLLTLPLVVVVTLIFSRGWPQPMGRLIVAGLCVVGIVGVSVWVLATSAVQPAVAAPAAAVTAERTPAELGAALFVAKGCRQCHVNLNAEGQTLFQIGPNLTEYQGNPEYLRLWLADPQSIRPETLMPNLNLADDEIEALVAFLSQ